METTLQSPTSNEKKSLTSGKNTSHRGNDAQCPTFPSRQTVVQAKLELTTPGDSYEQEADRMADHVMRSAFSVSDGDGQSPRQTMSRPIVSRRSSGSGGVAVDSQTESGIMSSRGGGSSLPTALRSRMETGFGADFSNVRIHNDSTAASLSNSIQAKAFTYGNDIYFNRGQYSPGSSDGQRLIAHELTHTLQQTGKIGRASDGEPENEEMERFKKLSFDKVLKYKTKDQYLQSIVTYAKSMNEDMGNYKKEKNESEKDKKKKIKDNKNKITGNHLLNWFGISKQCGNEDLKKIYFYKCADIFVNGIEDTNYVNQTLLNTARNNMANDRRNDGKGITIAIITDESADYNNRFKDINIFKNYDLSYFFILQGLNSLDAYIFKIKDLVEFFGPLQNLIISGHGTWDSISLDNDLLLVTSDPKERFKVVIGDDTSIDNYNTYYTSYINNIDSFQEQKTNTLKFFKALDKIMNASKAEIDPKNQQNIYLDSCNTNQDISLFVSGANFKQTMQQNIKGVNIWAMSAVTNGDYQNVVSEDRNGQFKVSPPSVDPDLFKEHSSYNGKDLSSIYAYYGHILDLNKDCRPILRDCKSKLSSSRDTISNNELILNKKFSLEEFNKVPFNQRQEFEKRRQDFLNSIFKEKDWIIPVYMLLDILEKLNGNQWSQVDPNDLNYNNRRTNYIEYSSIVKDYDNNPVSGKVYFKPVSNGNDKLSRFFTKRALQYSIMIFEDIQKWKNDLKDFSYGNTMWYPLFRRLNVIYSILNIANIETKFYMGKEFSEVDLYID